MAITFVDAGVLTIPDTAPVATWTLTTPGSWTAGRVVVYSVTAGALGASMSSHPGSTVLAWTSPGTHTITAGVGVYVVPSTPPGSVSLTWSAAQRGDWVWAVFDGVDQSSPVVGAGASAWSSSGTSRTAPSVSSVPAGSMVLGGLDLSSGSRSATFPGGWVQRAHGDERDGFLATKGIQESTGATGTAAMSFDGTETQARAWQAALREGTGPPEPSLTWSLIGNPTHEGITVSTRTQHATQVRVKVGTNSAVTTGVQHSDWVAPDAASWRRHTVTGLAPDAEHWYRVEMTDSESTVFESGIVGPFHTAPVPGTPKTFEFVFGGDSQEDQTNATGYQNAANRNARLMFITGDFHDGDNTSTSQDSHRADHEAMFAQNSGIRNLLSRTPYAYVRSDHDSGGGNNGPPGAWTAPNIAAYKQVHPHPPLPLDPDCLAWTIVYGRVRFIGLDATSQRTASTKLTTAQRSWLESMLTQPEPLKVIVQEGVWNNTDAPEAFPDGDGWADYPEERASIGEFITTHGVGRVIMLQGDQHCVSADDGSNNPHGGFPTYGGSPLTGNVSHKGVAPSQGRWPTSTGGAAQQYGRIQVTDDGEQISVQYNGYDAGNTSRVAHSFSFDAPLVEPVEAALAGATAPAAAAASVSVALTVALTTTTAAPTATASGGGTTTGALTASTSPPTTTAAAAAAAVGAVAGATPVPAAATTATVTVTATLTGTTPAPVTSAAGDVGSHQDVIASLTGSTPAPVTAVHAAASTAAALTGATGAPTTATAVTVTVAVTGAGATGAPLAAVTGDVTSGPGVEASIASGTAAPTTSATATATVTASLASGTPAPISAAHLTLTVTTGITSTTTAPTSSAAARVAGAATLTTATAPPTATINSHAEGIDVTVTLTGATVPPTGATHAAATVTATVTGATAAPVTSVTGGASGVEATLTGTTSPPVATSAGLLEVTVTVIASTLPPTTGTPSAPTITHPRARLRPNHAAARILTTPGGAA